MNDADLDIPDGDIEYGRKLYHAMCIDCHRLTQSNLQGPALGKIFGKKVGQVKGYRYYTPEIKSHDFYWNEVKLFQFLQNPEEVIADSGMVFDGIADPFDTASIIEYLKYLKNTTNPVVDR